MIKRCSLSYEVRNFKAKNPGKSLNGAAEAALELSVCVCMCVPFGDLSSMSLPFPERTLLCCDAKVDDNEDASYAYMHPASEKRFSPSTSAAHQTRYVASKRLLVGW